METEKKREPTEQPAQSQPLVRRSDLEKAWTCLGFMVFCGTHRGEKIGIALREFGAHQRGDVVFFVDFKDGMMNVSRPMEPRFLGGSGFISDWFSIVNVPREFVSELDSRDPMIAQTASH